MVRANSIKFDRFVSDLGRFVRSTPFKVLAGVTLLTIAVLMGATQGHTDGPLITNYSVADTTE